MNISICITVFNEEKSISALLESLVNQSKKAGEIVVVDGGSEDGTLEIIHHYQKKYPFIKSISEKCTRARGRNLSIELSKNEIVAITDGGCVADSDWLKNITDPFKTEAVDIVAGFYKMTGKSSLQKAEGVFLGVTPRKFNSGFLPSTRSMAFTKKAWEAVGGFPEGDLNSAEDTDFNYKAVKLGLKYSRVKNAVVEWGMPATLKDFKSKISDYSKWDIKYGIWWHPSQGIMSHNIKSLSIFFRYAFFAILISLAITGRASPVYPLIFIFTYFYWAYRKIYLEFGDWKISFWGPVLQAVSDIGVMEGFLKGLFK